MQAKTSRRTFVKGLTAGGILGCLGLWQTPIWAAPKVGETNVLSGTEFD
ncbi:twin-arginine translocation signal domain-containing protein, partial [Streptomyces sp. IBSBF 2953]|nr:twin-arginine translocation signal domain-containing protein [Streptomyces hayashii]